MSTEKLPEGKIFRPDLHWQAGTDVLFTAALPSINRHRRRPSLRAEADGLTPGDELAVFSTDGKKISSAKADADGSARIEIGHLAPGAYIAAAANNSFKFIK